MTVETGRTPESDSSGAGLEGGETAASWIRAAPDGPSATLVLATEAREAVARWAEDRYPHEACGLLIGSVAEGRTVVERAALARNLDRERAHDRYELDPADHLRAERTARAEGLDVVGIWHTHPDHPARPSRTDFERAWPGWSYLIASVGRGGLELRSWRLEDDAFVEEDIGGDGPPRKD